MISTMFWSAVLRVSETLLEATPTILVGLLVAAVLERYATHAQVRRLFGDGTWRSLFQAWLIGMLLPVCSLGVIPIVRVLRRAGVSGGTILAFAIAAPLFNPLSLLYGLTLSEPVTILVFAAASLVLVTAVGGIWDRLYPATGNESDDARFVPVGSRRMGAVVQSVLRESSGGSAVYLLAGLAGVGLLGAVLPHGCLQTSLNATNPWAPLCMTAVALPAYATPMTAMSQLGSMFQHGNSIGAAFALLSLGAGMNVGLAAWMVKTYGTRRSGAWLALLVFVVLGLAYGVERPLALTDIEAADHTHAFDRYGQPPINPDLPGHEFVWQTLRQETPPYQFWTVVALAVLAIVGRVAGARGWLTRWEESLGQDAVNSAAAPTESFQNSWHQRPVPAPVVAGVAIAGLAAFSLVGCFAYYPPAEEVFAEMFIAKGEALAAAVSGDHDHAEHWIDVWDQWTRKLQVGVHLREGDLSESRRLTARVLRDRLEDLEHALEDGDEAAIRGLVRDVEESYRQMREAYLPRS